MNSRTDHAPSSPPSESIRAQLLSSLVYPLCILWLISTVVAYFLAVSYANDSYDQALLNSAEAVAARLRGKGPHVLIDLPPAAQAILRHNNRDKFYYQILSEDGTRLAGDMVLPGPFPRLGSPELVLRFVKVNDEDVRLARIRVEIPRVPKHIFFVQVAETLNSRHQLAEKILLSIAVPQVLFILLGALTVSSGVSKGLQPLAAIKNALAVCSQLDLSPLSEDVPQEIRPLVRAINELLCKLRNDIETQKRFVANAAHQFRTPLAGLKTYIYLAKRLATGDGATVGDGRGTPTGETSIDADPKRAQTARDEASKALKKQSLGAAEKKTSSKKPNAVTSQPVALSSNATKGGERLQTVLDQIDAGTDRMTHLTNKLLALAKADPDIITERFAPVDLNLVVSEITAELAGEAMKKNMDLEFISDLNPATVLGNQDELTELVENLVENALLYTNAGGRVEVRIASSQTNGDLILIVEDNGPGIPKEERERVFERFYRILGSDVSGSGLGLAIVKEIVETHKARVTIDSGAGEVGTAVTVTFPAQTSN